MNLNLPPKVRVAIYITATMGNAVLIPLNVANVVPDLVMTVWASVSAAACGLAALNVTRK